MELHPLQRLTETFRLIGDKRVPIAYKLLPLAALLYTFWPFDISSDFIPFFGQIDDAAIIAGLLTLFVSMARKKVKERGR